MNFCPTVRHRREFFFLMHNGEQREKKKQKKRNKEKRNKGTCYHAKTKRIQKGDSCR